MLRLVRGATALVLAAIAGLHFAWARGSSFPFADRDALADSVVGAEAVPSPGACLTIAPSSRSRLRSSPVRRSDRPASAASGSRRLRGCSPCAVSPGSPVGPTCCRREARRRSFGDSTARCTRRCASRSRWVPPPRSSILDGRARRVAYARGSRAFSSAGRAPALQAGGRGFDPRSAHAFSPAFRSGLGQRVLRGSALRMLRV